jgi:hypothetical protein
LSGRGLCDELITRPEESYRLWYVVVCDLETSRMGAPYIYDISSLSVNDVTLFCSSMYWIPSFDGQFGGQQAVVGVCDRSTHLVQLYNRFVTSML